MRPNRNEQVSKVIGGFDKPRPVSDAQILSFLKTVAGAEQTPFPVADAVAKAAAHTVIQYSPSDNPPSKAPPFRQVNKNMGEGARDILETANAPTYENEQAEKAAKVELRKACARYCRFQGRTSCNYCKGAGFAAMGEPSRNTKRAHDNVAKSHAPTFTKV